MAGRIDQEEKIGRAPAVTLLLMSWIADKAISESLVGDFQEEFARRCDESRAQALLWCWREVLASTPRLLAKRFDDVSLREVVVFFMAMLVTYQMINLFDHEVATLMVNTVRESHAGVSLGVLWSVRLGVEMLGIAGGAMFLCVAVGSRRVGLGSRGYLKVVPLAIVVLAPPLAITVRNSETCPYWWFFVWSGLAIWSLWSGATLGARVRRIIA